MKEPTNLRRQLVNTSVVRPWDAQVLLAEVVQGFIVHNEGAVGVLQRVVRGEHRVVRLHNGSRHLQRGWMKHYAKHWKHLEQRF